LQGAKEKKEEGEGLPMSHKKNLETKAWRSNIRWGKKTDAKELCADSGLRTLGEAALGGGEETKGKNGPEDNKERS